MQEGHWKYLGLRLTKGHRVGKSEEAINMKGFKYADVMRDRSWRKRDQ